MLKIRYFIIIHILICLCSLLFFLFIQVPDRLDEMRSPCSDYHGNL